MRHLERVRPWLAHAMAALVLILGFGPVGAQPAGDLSKLDSSLKLIPADAAFYSVMLRNREQVEAVLKSKALARLQNLPEVQKWWKMAEAELAKNMGQFAPFMQILNQPENRQLVELLTDMASNEIFIYGAESCHGFAELMTQMSGFQRASPALMKLAGKGDNLTDDERQMLILFHGLLQNLDGIKVPDFIIGFKLTGKDKANAQLKRLEELLGNLAENEPMLKGRLARAKVGASSFLTLTFDGKMIPWKDVPFKKLETKPGEFEPIVKKLTQLKATISLGVRDNYLLLGVGESTAAIAKLGQGKKLAEQKELKPLARHADQKLTSIAYVSKTMHAKMAASKKDIDDMVETANSMLPLADLPAELKARIKKDMEAFARDIKGMIPEVGAGLAYSMTTTRGHETFAYDWSERPGIDGSKPLTLLNHAGGSPLFVAVGRVKHQPENYQAIVKWVKVLHGYFEDLAVPMMDEENKKQYRKFAKIAYPLLKRLDEVTGKMLLPALADGQTGVVLDAKLTSKQWFQGLPPSAKPLPILEPACLMGVSDSSLLERAMTEYRNLANDIIARVREVSPEVPEFKLPAPESRKGKNGTLYFYPIPAEAGVDRRVVPTAGLSKSVAALTISHEHAERLLASTPLKTAGGPLADTRRPMAAASYLDWAGMVDALTPWVDLAIPLVAMQVADGEKPDPRAQEEIRKQVHTVLGVLKVIRSVSACVYFEDGAWVTHSETIIRDE